MKKVLLFVLIVLSVLIIYSTNRDKKTYYLALGNSGKYVFDCNSNKVKGYSFYVQWHLKEKKLLEKFVYGFAKEDIRLPELINSINDNAIYEGVSLKNALIKADLVTLNINIDDIFLKLNEENIIYGNVYDYVDELTIDLEKLFGLIRKYCKEEILFIGAYNPYSYKKDDNIEDIIYYINEKYKSACKKYDINFVDISGVDTTYLANNKCFNLNADSYKLIGKEVIKISNKVLFNA